jgi:hypothetical protein
MFPLVQDELTVALIVSVTVAPALAIKVALSILAVTLPLFSETVPKLTALLT